MRHEEHWQTFEDLGAGGQGKVSKARDRRIFDLDKKRRELINAFQNLAAGHWQNANPALDTLLKEMDSWKNANDPCNLAALKILHAPKDAKDPEHARERIKREMSAMSRVSHPNLLRVIEPDPDGQWFAAEYHSGGTLSKRLDMFKGNVLHAVRAFRGVVEGVAKLHTAGMVHRDIKPDNIFIAGSGELVLGDFGLVFFNDTDHTRLSGTLENIGSHKWMPAWAMETRIEDVKPSFDVFSLGKVLWAMLSGRASLLLWYLHRPDSDLERLFPNCPFIGLGNQLLDKCVVEHEKDCLPNANDLLAEVDDLLRIIDRDGQLLGDGTRLDCRVCGLGCYVPVQEADFDNLHIRKPAGNRQLKAFCCNHCGHFETFLFPDKNLLPAWYTASMAIVGKWVWPEEEVVEFRADGTGVASKGPTFTWKCLDAKARRFEATWNTNAIDTISLAAGGLSLTLINNGDWTWTAKRLSPS